MRYYSRLISKVLIWVPVIIMAGTIFGFSKQDGEQSQGLSERVAGVIIDFADDTGIITIDNNRDDYIEMLQTPIRKGAHMSEYAVLGILVFIALAVDGVKGRLRYIAALCGSVTFAVTDEIHQLFVPGRAGKLMDVCIDACGVLIGLGVCFMIIHMTRKIKGHKDERI